MGGKNNGRHGFVPTVYTHRDYQLNHDRKLREQGRLSQQFHPKTEPIREKPSDTKKSAPNGLTQTQIDKRYENIRKYNLRLARLESLREEGIKTKEDADFVANLYKNFFEHSNQDSILPALIGQAHYMLAKEHDELSCARNPEKIDMAHLDKAIEHFKKASDLFDRHRVLSKEINGERKDFRRLSLKKLSELEAIKKDMGYREKILCPKIERLLSGLESYNASVKICLDTALFVVSEADKEIFNCPSVAKDRYNEALVIFKDALERCTHPGDREIISKISGIIQDAIDTINREKKSAPDCSLSTSLSRTLNDLQPQTKVQAVDAPTQIPLPKDFRKGTATEAINEARQCIYLGMFMRAIAILNDAIRQEPNNQTALRLRAKACKKQADEMFQAGYGRDEVQKFREQAQADENAADEIRAKHIDVSNALNLLETIGSFAQKFGFANDETSELLETIKNILEVTGEFANEGNFGPAKLSIEEAQTLSHSLLSTIQSVKPDAKLPLEIQDTVSRFTTYELSAIWSRINNNF